MSLLPLVPKLGPVSNREVEFKTQNILAIGTGGRLRFAPFPERSDLLPPEILAEIFIRCLPDGYFVLPDLTTAPLILCGICRRWRDVALTTPTLWSSLFVDFDGMGETKAQRAEMWLSRAGGSPLSICSRGIPGGSLLRTLIRLSQQWRRIEVHWDMSVDSASDLFPADGRFPSLERLDISIAGHLSLREAPRLREVSIYLHNPQIQLPWHQLTALRCYYLPGSSCLEILRKSPNLLDGTFSFTGDLSGLPPSILQHNNLQHLDLHTREQVGDAPLPILNCLRIPSLKSLTLKFPYYPGTLPVDISPFRSFVSQSFCELSTLALSYIQTTPDDLIECLKATPSLVCLKLVPHVAIDIIFARLTGQIDFLPKLESFHTFFPYNHTTWHVDVSVVVHMLCWRWAAVGIARLQSFRLGYHTDRKEPRVGETLASHSECQALRAEGMDLYFGETSHIDELASL
ncbi:hypothetical protein DFH06DRAFT_1159159 [Mycena polygramma]|nr:hypothetical protein DFH06DRAFT_1159159 [Mycena polygramma]